MSTSISAAHPTHPTHPTRPIDVILDGTNYNQWSQNMTIYLKGISQWRTVTSPSQKPVQGKDEELATFHARLDTWESTQCKILSWFINTSSSAIQPLLSRLESAHEAWLFLAKRYKCKHDAFL